MTIRAHADKYTKNLLRLYKQKKHLPALDKYTKMGNPSHLEQPLLPQGFHRAAQATPESGENLFEMILAKRNICWEPHLLPSKYGFV